jgi:hypothetical protein
VNERGAVREDDQATVALERVQAEFRVVEELERIRELRSRLNGERVARAEFDAAAEVLDADTRADLQPVLDVLLAARLGIARHPAAAASVFRAVCAEGARYAATPEGSARAAALAADPRMADLRRLWEATSLNMLGDSVAEPAGIPAGWLELLLETVMGGDSQQLVDRLAPKR